MYVIFAHFQNVGEGFKLFLRHWKFCFGKAHPQEQWKIITWHSFLFFFIDDEEVRACSGLVKSIILIWCFMYRKIQYGTLLCTCIEERLFGTLVHWRSEGFTYIYGPDAVYWLQVNIFWAWPWQGFLLCFGFRIRLHTPQRSGHLPNVSCMFCLLLVSRR